MKISFVHRGDFKNTEKLLNSFKSGSFHFLNKYGEEGVAALSAATPKRTGKTSASWAYEIQEDQNGITISWNNTNVNKHVNIAVILQTGHGTRNGGYVTGINYIEPALEPLFQKIANDAWEEVVSK